MFTPEDMENFSNNQVVEMYEKLNMELSKTIIKKLKSLGDVSSYTRSQIRTLQLQYGKEIFYKTLDKTNGLTAKRKKEIKKLFDEIGEKALEGYTDVYKLKGLDYELSAENIQLLNKIIQRTNGELKNLTKSIAYASENQFISAVDNLYKEVITGAYDYSSAMKRTITDLAQKGVTLRTKDGRNEKLEVAVRRNLMTSIHQTAQSIAKDVGDVIGANCVVIGHSSKCRPTHHVIDAVTMSIKQFQQYEYLTEEYNCYHIVNYDWQPEFENQNHGVIYDDEHISYAKAVQNYNIQQKARYLERNVRQLKRTIVTEGNTKENRAKLRMAQSKLRIYNRQNGLEQDYLRTWTPYYNK